MAPRYLLSLFLMAILSQHASARKLVFWRTQFQHWFPSFEPVFDHIRRENCSSEFDLYLYGNSSSPINPLLGGGSDNRLAQPLVECLLKNTSEFIKSSMASAQVLLGLTPSILSILGPSAEEIAVLCVIGRRQFLSLLIVGGAPAVFPDRAFKLESPTKILHDHEGRLHNAKWSTMTERVVLVIEYIITIVSIANLAHTCYLLGIRTICNFAPEIPYFPMLWTWIGIGTHLISCWAMHLRVKEKHSYQTISKWQFLKAQFKPLTEQAPMRFKTRNESRRSIALSWLASIMIMIHIIFGTLCWSSLMFIGVKDSVIIITRFMISAIASRGVLMYELGLLRNAHINISRFRGDPEFELVRTESDFDRKEPVGEVLERPERIRTNSM